MKRIFPVFGLALWSALNSQILLANVPASAMPLLPDAERQAQGLGVLMEDDGVTPVACVPFNPYG